MRKYDRLYNQIVKSVKGSQEHEELKMQENVLLKEGIALRRKMGIYAEEPCYGRIEFKCQYSCTETLSEGLCPLLNDQLQEISEETQVELTEGEYYGKVIANSKGIESTQEPIQYLRQVQVPKVRRYSGSLKAFACEA